MTEQDPTQPTRRAGWGLGRGLGALIPPATPQVEMVEVAWLEANPLQPRHTLDPQAVRELAESIREHGVLQPLLVTRLGPAASGGLPRYGIIAGERRWQAARQAGLARVPVMVMEASPREVLELALVENLQRTDLNPLEEAGAYRRLVEEFGLSQEEVSRRVGKGRSTVTNALRLLTLRPEIRESLVQGDITAGHARALLSLADEAGRRALWQRVVQEGWSVRQTEEAARGWGTRDKPHASAPERAPDPELKRMEEELRAALGTKVELHRGRNGGRIVIHFYSDEELESLYDRLILPR